MRKNTVTGKGSGVKRRVTLILAIVLAVLSGTAVSFAAPDAGFALVSPVPAEPVIVVDTNNILISVKVTQPQVIRVSAYQQKQLVNGQWKAVTVSELEDFANKNIEEKKLESLMEPVDFECGNNLSFYTKKLESITPGLYKIKIESLDSAGETVYGSSYEIIVKEKTEDEEKDIDTPKTGTSQFLQNLLKKIFGN